MHFAAYASVPLSVKIPQDYYQNNVINSINLLNMMIKFDVEKLFFHQLQQFMVNQNIFQLMKNIHYHQ